MTHFDYNSIFQDMQRLAKQVNDNIQTDDNEVILNTGEPNPFVAEHVPVLSEMYAILHRLDLPDVYVGYFIHSPDKMQLDYGRLDSPASINGGPFEGKVIRFGSDGGGSSLVIHVETKSILLIPSFVGIENQIVDGKNENIFCVAPNIQIFLKRLKQDIQHYLQNTPNWFYLTSGLY